MQRQLLAGVALVAMAGSAFAADMPLKALPRSQLMTGAEFISAASSAAPGGRTIFRIRVSESSGRCSVFPSFRPSIRSGFIGGIEGGSRYQIGKLVVGWEGDITWGGLQLDQHARASPGR